MLPCRVGIAQAEDGMILLGFAHAFKAIPAVLGGMAIFAHAEERE